MWRGEDVSTPPSEPPPSDVRFDPLLSYVRDPPHRRCLPLDLARRTAETLLAREFPPHAVPISADQFDWKVNAPQRCLSWPDYSGPMLNDWRTQLIPGGGVEMSQWIRDTIEEVLTFSGRAKTNSIRRTLRTIQTSTVRADFISSVIQNKIALLPPTDLRNMGIFPFSRHSLTPQSIRFLNLYLYKFIVEGHDLGLLYRSEVHGQHLIVDISTLVCDQVLMVASSRLISDPFLYLVNKHLTTVLLIMAKSYKPFTHFLVDKICKDYDIGIIKDKQASLLFQKLIACDLVSDFSLNMMIIALKEYIDRNGVADLVCDPYANYVLSRVFARGAPKRGKSSKTNPVSDVKPPLLLPWFMSYLVLKMSADFNYYVDHRHASPILDSCLRSGSQSIYRRIIRLICGLSLVSFRPLTEEQKEGAALRIRGLMKHKFANYVVQTAVDALEPDELAASSDEIRELHKILISGIASSMVSSWNTNEAYNAKMMRKYIHLFNEEARNIILGIQ